MAGDAPAVLVERFRVAKAALIAAGIPADVVDATLRPLWRAALQTWHHRETRKET